MSKLATFNFKAWTDEHRHLLNTVVLLALVSTT